MIAPGDLDFAASGLTSSSVSRLGFLAVLPPDRLLGAVGSIAKARHERLLARLCDYLLRGRGAR